MNLVRGANTAVPTATLRVELSWQSREDAHADVSGLLCTGRRVRSDADFVFYNQRTHVSGSLQHEGKNTVGSSTVTDVLTVELAKVEADVDLIAIVASLDAGPGVGFGVLSAAGLALTVQDVHGAVVAGIELAGLEQQTAVVGAEFYRRDGAWKVRAVGQGYDDGLAGLARDFGVDVDAPEDEAAAAGNSEGAPPGESPAPAWDWRNPPVPVGYGS